MLPPLLEQVGFAGLEATNGWAALGMCAGQRQDLILVDLRMPGMDGRVRSGPENTECGMRTEGGQETHTLVVAVTADATSAGGPSVLGAGFDDVVYKPFSASELLEKIGRQLGARYVPHPSGACVGERVARGAAAVVPADMAVLPAERIEELSRALRRGQPAELLTLIDRIRPAHADLAGALARLVRIREFHTLLAVTEGARKEASHG